MAEKVNILLYRSTIIRQIKRNDSQISRIDLLNFLCPTVPSYGGATKEKYVCRWSFYKKLLVRRLPNAQIVSLLQAIMSHNNGILFWPTVRKKMFYCSRKHLKFEVEGQEFAKLLRSIEQFIQAVKGQNNFWQYVFWFVPGGFSCLIN